ncbi:MAG TPA: YicC/YloC family endoribonuclease [Candidatus Kapabacteria bacterium]|nr:YicC/YloC family endoribonuclease [Candidatus Kapabacteria bacterium]
MKSMTGFSEGRFELEQIALHVSFRSWNHRFLEITFKGSGITPESEKLIKEMMKDKVHRGKIEVFFDLFHQDKSKYTVQLNELLLSEILDKLVHFKQKYDDKISLSLDALLKIPMIFRLDYASEHFAENDTTKIFNCLEKVFADFLHSREIEGRAMAAELRGNCEKIGASLESVKSKADQVEREIFARFKEKMARYLSEAEIDERRIIQEAAIMAEKGCINEEIHRLETHTKRLKDIIDEPRLEVKGKEADFLAQEMMRETHTIASKTDSMDIHAQVLEIRREIEKIKQQVQNVE